MNLDPRDVLGLVGRAPASALQAVSLLPRTFALIESAELLVQKADALIDRIEMTRRNADDLMQRTDSTVDGANKLVVTVAGTVASVEPTLDRAQRLFDAFEPALDKLQPIVGLLANSIQPKEVDALIRLIDHLPDLVDRTIADILPIVESMSTVAPDIHDLLDTMHELNEMLAKVPGMGRIRRRVEEKQSDQD